MNLKNFDDKCVKITTATGEVYEGIVSYCGKEYVFHEYGQNQEALLLVPIIIYKKGHIKYCKPGRCERSIWAFL